MIKTECNAFRKKSVIKIMYEEEVLKIKKFVKVFNSVFSLNVSVENFYYKHYLNPYRVEPPILEGLDGDKVVAINGYMGAKLKIFDLIVDVVQGCDTATLSEYRKSNAYIDIYEKAEMKFKEWNIFLRFGFPNNIAVKMCKITKDVYIGNFYRVVLPVNFGACVTDVTNSKLGKVANIFNPIFKARRSLDRFCGRKLQVEMTKECPFTLADINRINATSQIMVVKTIDYYKWKVDFNKARDYHYCISKYKGELLGFVIYEKNSRGIISIIDWKYFKNECFSAKTVLRFLFGTVAKFGIVVSVGMVNKANYEYSLLKSIGFLGNKNDFAQLWIKIYNKKNKKNVINCEDWELRMIDADTILQ